MAKPSPSATKHHNALEEFEQQQQDDQQQSKRALLMIRHKEQPSRRCDNYNIHRVIPAVEALVEAMQHESPFFQSHPCKSVPVFLPNEIVTGAVVGEGPYGTIREVKDLRLTDKSSKTLSKQVSILLRSSTFCKSFLPGLKPKAQEAHEAASPLHENHSFGSACFDASEHPDDDGEDDPSETFFATKLSRDRASLRHRVIKSQQRQKPGTCKNRLYAAKCVREDLAGKVQFDASLDLAREALLLSSLQGHGNICQMYGYAGIPGRPNFMVLVDQFDMTLEEMLVDWQLRQMNSEKGKGRGGCLCGLQSLTPAHRRRKQQSEQELLAERLSASFQISQALLFLHENKLIHRDLNPANIGVVYSERTEDSPAKLKVKLFDFGFAKELKERDKVLSGSSFEDDEEDDTEVDGGAYHHPQQQQQQHEDVCSDQLYHGTARVGTPIYMAPEVVWGKPYGVKADVYSFAILMCQLLSLEEPFPGMTTQQHAYSAVQRGTRPRLPKHIDSSLKKLLQRAWSGKSHKRPSMEQVSCILREHAPRRSSVSDSSRRLVDDSARMLVSSHSLRATKHMSKAADPLDSNEGSYHLSKSKSNRSTKDDPTEFDMTWASDGPWVDPSGLQQQHKQR